MLPIEWTQPALADLIEIETFIEKESPEAAHAVAQRIWDASQNLSNQPLKGREGYVEGTREWVVNKTPCILVYRVQAEQIEILYVHHDRQNWKA
jgi:toxin ParE1/3/4